MDALLKDPQSRMAQAWYTPKVRGTMLGFHRRFIGIYTYGFIGLRVSPN